MRAAAVILCALFGVALTLPGPAPAGQPAATPDPIKFRTQEIDAGLKIGYAVVIADINGDKKPDILVVDQFQVVWYENPTWKKRVILDGKTKPDNVCAAVLDIDGDGQLDIVLGAGWQPTDTKNAGTLQWLKRGKSLDEPWTMYPIPCDEPTVHRVRAIDIDGDGKPEIVHVPLQGRECTAKGNWTDGRAVRVIAYKVPANPEKPESWKPMVLSDELHTAHNFAPWPAPLPGKPPSILCASYEGVSVIHAVGADWKTDRIHEGNQANPKSNRGASEIKPGKIGTRQVIATIEPWHGNQVVTYTPNDEKKAWDRHVIDEQLRWGHAVWFADLDGDGSDELLIGVRDNPNPKAGDKHAEKWGVRVYKCTDGTGAAWTRQLVDEGGVAVEDLATADLDGDGRIDIVAVGRATKNCRIYWNQGR